MSLHPEEPADLRLEHVSKSFGAVVAVDDISLSIQSGRFYSLLGPSGCGKTTTLRLVAGFERPDSGRILLSGADVGRIPPHHRRVNTVFQHYALFPHLTVEDNVAYGLKQRRTPKEQLKRRLDETLATVRLTELRARRPRELSGGQQQRVALARALINEPTVLLLDEPLAALDLKLRRAMQQELKKLQERVGITFVYVTHDQEEALALSDRIAVMNEGRILQEGTATEIYERPRSRFVADFIGETNFFEGVVEEAGAEVLVRDSTGLRLRCTAADVVTTGQEVVISVRPEKISLTNGHKSWANTVDGTLMRRTYLGDIVHYHVLLQGGAQITVQQQNLAEDRAGEIGAPITVGWDAGSALVMQEVDRVISDEEDIRLLADPDRPD